MKQEKTHILVTGSHRSGSTWVGNIIGQSEDVFYVHEPFNIALTEEASPPFNNWFEYVSDESSKAYQEKVIRYINKYSEGGIRYAIRGITDVSSRKTLRKYLFRVFNLVKNKRILYKDPIAFMSAEWLAEKLPANVIVLVRHPAAFVASLKVKNWQFDFKNFSEQKLLLNSKLEKYKPEIIQYSVNRPNIILQGILIWNIIHELILMYQEEYNDEWYFIRHEDLSRNPVEEFRSIFDYLNLELPEKIEAKIINSTTAKAEKNLQRDLVRDSKKNIKTWKKRLTKEEIELIYNGTKGVWKEFYSEYDW